MNWKLNQKMNEEEKNIRRKEGGNAMTIEQMIERKKELGFTYEQISDLTGIPISTVQKVLGGFTQSPRYATLAALENLLEDPMRSIFVTKEAAPAYYGVTESDPEPKEKKQGYFTLEDYYAIPDDRRVELIEGVIYDMSAPTVTHQLIAGAIHTELSLYIRRNKGKCIPMISPVDVQIKCDDKNMVQPDVFVLCDRSRFKEENIYGAPEFIVEVISPSSRRKDNFTKLLLYCEAGVREYWLVDPKKKYVLVYDLQNEEVDMAKTYTFEEKVPVGIFDGKCLIDFKEIDEYITSLQEE